MEKWDLYDAQRKPLHRTHERSKPLEPDTYHVVAGICMLNSQKQVLLTLRSPEKQYFPNHWELPGGSVLTNETSLAGARREFFEETGIQTNEIELTLFRSYQEENCFFDVYVLKRDVPATAVILQEGETADARWFTLEEVELLMSQKKMIPTESQVIVEILKQN